MSKTYYTFTTNLSCDKSITEQGKAVVSGLSVSNDGCNVQVDMKHAAGCPQINMDKTLGYIEEHPWIIATLYLVAGPLIALFGLSWFPYVAAGVVALFVMTLVGSICMAFGWMAGTIGTLICAFVALGLGILAGMLVRRQIWFMMMLLGVVAGFFLGTLVYTLVAAGTGWAPIWAYWTLGAVCGLLGGWLAYSVGKATTLMATSFIGSYLFMRAWTLYFPKHWIDEAAVISGEADFEYTWQIGVFLGTFAVGLLFSLIF